MNAYPACEEADGITGDARQCLFRRGRSGILEVRPCPPDRGKGWPPGHSVERTQLSCRRRPVLAKLIGQNPDGPPEAARRDEVGFLHGCAGQPQRTQPQPFPQVLSGMQPLKRSELPLAARMGKIQTEAAGDEEHAFPPGDRFRWRFGQFRRSDFSHETSLTGCTPVSIHSRWESHRMARSIGHEKGDSQ